METLSQEISYLAPLAEEGALASAIHQQQEFLASQELLLVTYQDSYTALLVSGKITSSSNEVAVQKGYRPYFLGAQPEVIEALQRRFQLDFPAMESAGLFKP